MKKWRKTLGGIGVTFLNLFLYQVFIAFSELLLLPLVGLKQYLIRWKTIFTIHKIFTGLLDLLRNIIKY